MSKRFIKLSRMDKGEATQQGFLRVPASFTRVGVFKYRKADGTIVRELRHPDDVFAPESIASLKMAPLTDDHPKDFVTPENVKELSVGWISDTIELNNNKVDGTVVVAEKKAIAKANAGKVELSCGYTADLKDESGEFEGEPYDCRQVNIRYNHVAMVDKGRAGPTVRMRLDSDDAEEVTKENETQTEETQMEKIKIGDQEFEVSKQVADAFNAHMQKMNDEMTSLKGQGGGAGAGAPEVKELQQQLDNSKEEATKLQAKVDSLEQKLSQKKDGLSQDEIGKAVRARISIEKTATAVLGSDAKLDSKSDLEVMKEVLKKECPKLDDAKLSDETYVRARFDGITEDLDGREARRFQLSDKTKNDKREDKDFDADAAKNKSHADAQDEWKQPLSSSKVTK